ncbi:iron ABC transporter substrate-binding protein [Agrobacterium sp. Ap1]|jgi:D-methionine transport system substrate-binding protein|uniref:MetQ/NlpA family ABC transporter substrate-binding protein n=1 Tax=Rhizobium/Agrobacterium group TaxID=227290 RepID=UPI001A8D9041|nr:MetQ/NlpA family ABC transporter substrate-binding protein [Agrobacterium sp. Ap1]MBO0142727.1 iron ABC transporter substrate-binding protein [Agrobacterium sp. Ap1]
MVSLRHILSAAILIASSLTTSASMAQDDKPLRIALATSISNQAAEVAVEEAKAQGLKIELTEFNDWNTPNMAVADREMDANLFQHIPYLEFTNQAGGRNLVPVAPAYATPFGLYSKKYKSLEELPDNAQIAFSGDAVNTGRSLLLLQQAKLVELKPGTGHRATLEDVVKWVKPLRIVQLDGPQIARALDDVDAAATYPTFAKLAGLDPASGLIFENDPIYAFQFVTRPDMRDDPRLRKFIDIYRGSDAVKAKLRSLYGDLVSFP